MPKIPDYLDYGARPSLRTTRVDMPGQADQILADSLANAAASFANVVAERGAEEDRLTYTRLKTELLTEDVRIQRELQEAGNWETYEQDYRVQIAEARERIQGQITNANDRVIFDADANLLTERGATAMATEYRNAWLDNEVASLEGYLAQARHDIIAAQPYQRRDMVQAAHARVAALVEYGVLDPTEARATQVAFITDVAGAELTAMDKREALIMLDRAIEANLDPNDITADTTTGSLADFLPQDVRIEMARKLRDEVEAEDTTLEAQAASDYVFATWQADTAENEAERYRWIRENTEGEVRNQALTMARERTAEIGRIQAGRAQEVVDEWTAKFMQGKPAYTVMLGEGDEGQNTVRDPANDGYWSYYDIPAAQRELLSAGQQVALQNLATARQQGRSFALATEMVRRVDADGNEMPSFSLWRRMTQEQKAAVNLDSAEWLMAFNEADWRLLNQEQEQIRNGTAPDIRDLATNNQLVRDALIRGGWVPATDRNVEEHKTFAEVILELNRRTMQEQTRPGRDQQIGYPSYETRAQMLAEIMTTKSFTGGGGFTGWAGRAVDWVPGVDEQDWRGTGADAMMNFYEMTDEQVEEGWLPMSGGPPGYNASEEMISIPGADDMSVQAYLIGLAAQYDPELDGVPPSYWDSPEGRRRLERAWFAWRNEMPDAEVERRLRGE